MSHASPHALQQRCQQIVTSPVLTPEQKRHFLALEAENNLPYPALPQAARTALEEGFICDMFEARHGWNWKGQRIWMTRSHC